MSFIKKSFFVLLSFICFKTVFSQSPNLGWYSSQGGTGADYAYSVKADLNGNVFTSGFFQGTVSFGTGNNITNLTSAGLSDSYIMKHNANGLFQWAIRIGGTMSDYIFSTQTDDQGNVYVAGYFKGTCDFDPSATNVSLTASANFDIFCAKYNTDGQLVWAKKIGGSGDELCNTIHVNNNKLFIAGHFSQTADFNPATATSSLTATGTMDGFVCEWDTAGNFNWVKQLKGTDAMVIKNISTNNNGDLLVCGYFGGGVDFDPGQSDSSFVSAGQDDAFVLKLNSTGEFLWARTFGGSSTDYALSARFNSASEVFVAGYFSSSASFNFPNDTVTFTSAGLDDSYLCKLDENGNLIWIQQYGSTSYDEFKSIYVDNNSNVIIAGVFNGTVDFNQSATTNTLTSGGGDDAFILKLDSDGNYQWAVNLSGAGNGYAFGLDVDLNKNILVSGHYSSSCDFDPSGATSSSSSNGSTDAFVVKLIEDASTGFTDIQREKITILAGSNKKFVIKSPVNQKAFLFNSAGQLLTNLNLEKSTILNAEDFSIGIYFIKTESGEALRFVVY